MTIRERKQNHVDEFREREIVRPRKYKGVGEEHQV